ncbi:hypothetical protein HN873_029173, partial [Arachis hypogaea]
MAWDTMMLEVKNGMFVGQESNTESINQARCRVNDPAPVHTKGTGRDNDCPGNKGPKKRKCSSCGVLGHRRSCCPNKPSSSKAFSELLSDPECCQANSQSDPITNVELCSMILGCSNAKKYQNFIPLPD